MIPARKNAAFSFVVSCWLGAVVRRRFHAVYVAGSRHLASLDPARPVVGCANHTNWWDGFVLFILCRRLMNRDVYLAMEEKNLRRYRFFSWMGCFGLDLEGSALPGLRYAIRLLRGNPRRLIWMFVQGRLAAPHVPVTVKSGALLLARRAEAQLLPVALRYEWLAESRPSVMVRFGAPMDAEATSERLAAVLNGLVVETMAAIDPVCLRECEPLDPPGVSIHSRWDRWVRFMPGSRRGNPGG